jgi:hypothetical protein
VDGVLFLNEGSVGKLNDADQRAAWVVLDTTGDVNVKSSFPASPITFATLRSQSRGRAARRRH